MDKIQIVNVLLTRKCNLRCSYCNLVKNYLDKPKEYPDMNHYCNNELSAQKWIEIIERIFLNNKNSFFIFYGGEPFLYKDLDIILYYCNVNEIHYTVISNNTDEINSKFNDVYKNIGKFSGFTSSVDPIISDLRRNDDIVKKSISGFQKLCSIKKNKVSDDVVAEITVTKDSIDNLISTVKMLSDNGIYSSITCLDDQKNNYYDFSSIVDKDQMIIPDKRVKAIFQNLYDSAPPLLIHIPQILLELYKVLPSNMKCKIYEDVHNLTIDSDGSFRLCLRIRGIESPKLKLDEVIDSEGKIQEQFKNSLKCDYDKCCQGCNHTCLLMSKMFSNQIVNH